MAPLLTMDESKLIMNFINGTSISDIPTDPRHNSTQAFDHSTTLEKVAYQANFGLFLTIMGLLGIAMIVPLPHMVIRMKNATSIFNNFVLLKGKIPPKPDPTIITKTETSTSTAVPTTTRRPPYRLAHLHIPLPVYQVPYIDLPLNEFVVVLVLWIVGVGVAAWCQTNFLTDASRSTLIIMALLSLTAALGIKGGGVGTWIQVGYTAVNFLHRWTGRLVILLSTLHVVAYLAVFARDGVFKAEMAKPENYLAFMAYGGLVLAGVVSIGYIRNRWWMIFKFGHHVGVALVLAGLNYHSPGVISYLLAIYSLIIINIVVRSLATRYTKAELLVLPGAESTLVTFSGLSKGFTPGQHVRLRLWSLVPELGWKSGLEAHPFTIATANDGGQTVQLVIKKAGDWTTAVYNLVNESEGGLQVRCSVEGPYGAFGRWRGGFHIDTVLGGPINFIYGAFESVLIVVGGSGVSFGLGVVRGILSDTKKGKTACKNLTLVWTVREKHNLEALLPQLEEIVHSAQTSAINFHLRLCYTSKIPSSPPLECKRAIDVLLESCDVSTHVQVSQGRPDLSTILGQVMKDTMTGGVGVGGCGPLPMVQDMARLVERVPRLMKKTTLPRLVKTPCRPYSSYNSAIAGLTTEQEEFRQVVSDFAQKEIAPRAAEIDKTNKMPADIFPKLGDMGLLGVTVPEKWGGLGLGYFEHTIAMEELSRASAAVALSYGVSRTSCSIRLSSHLESIGALQPSGQPTNTARQYVPASVSTYIVSHDCLAETQLTKYLPPLLSGQHIGSLAMSEPNSGSDVVSMRTKAELQEGKWIMNGSKCWITNAPLSSTFLVYARSSKEGPPSKGLTAFIVEKGMKGFEVGESLDKFGMRGSPTAELFFDNVEIPPENVLGTVGKGASVLMSGLDLERLVLSGGPLGIMQAALDLTLEYTHSREQFGKKIATFQLMQGKIADMYTKLSASRAYVYAVARACDAGKISRQDCAGAILYSSDRAVELAMEAQQCLGGNGYVNDYPAGRLLRDSRLYTVGAGTQEIRRMLIGRGFNEAFAEADGKMVAQ
ncbi:isovaleryl-CoA dehydrogenase, partial [Tremellales sp. Uapishka_1]